MTATWSGLDSRVLAYILGLWILYKALLALYRITLHPLARFPGPKLAGASYCYEFWFDVIRHGRYTKEILRLHERYGPIVRINPDELHCKDPNFIDEIYGSGHRKRNKTQHYISNFPAHMTMAGVATKDHLHHRLRRSAVNKFFSRAQILKLESVVHQNSQKLCDKLLSFTGQAPFEAGEAYSCFTTDTIAEYCFGQSTGFLDQPDWVPNYKHSTDLIFKIVHILRYFPWLRYLMDWIPVAVVQFCSRDMGIMMADIKIEIPERIRRLSANLHTGSFKHHPTIFLELLTSNLPESEKATARLAAEASAIMIAGTETTATVILLATYHLLQDIESLQKAREELQTVVSDASDLPGWLVLEKLPYLRAIIMEGIRLMYGASQRMARIAPEEDLFYHGSWTPPGGKPTQVDHVIPRGYAIGMSNFIMHSDEAIFPNAMQFIPKRWLVETSHLEHDLEHYMLSFARGSRQCLGMQLAYCELYVCMAALILRVFPRMKLYKTEDKDIFYDHDEIIPKPRSDSNGLRVLILDG